MWQRHIELLITYDADISSDADNTTPSNAVPSTTSTGVGPLVIVSGRPADEVEQQRNTLRISKNRIDFKYESHIGAGGDILKIDVYNLDINTVNTLMSDRVKSIKVSVGYLDGPINVLSEGFITNVSGTKVMPNHITSLFVVPKFQYQLGKNSQLNKVVIKSDQLINVVKTLVKDIGFSTAPRFFNMPDDILFSNVRGYVFDGTPKQALRDLGAQYGFFVKPTKSTVNIVSRLSSYDSVKKLIDGRITKHSVQMNKVKGNPKVDVGLIQLVYNLDASINAADVLDVSALILSNGEGRPQASSILDANNAASVLYRSDDLWKSLIVKEYLIRHVTHVGSNYTNAWDTIIEGTYFIKNTIGKNPGNGDKGFDETIPPDIDVTNGVHQIPTMKVVLASGEGEEDTHPNQKWINDTPPVPNVGGDQNYSVPKGEYEQDEEDSYVQPEDYKQVPASTPMPQPKGKGYDQQSEEADKKVGNTYSHWFDKNARTGAPPTISGAKPTSSSSYGKDWKATNTPASDVLSPATRNLADIIAKGESGGDYNNIFNSKYKQNPNSKPLTDLTIGEVKDMGSQNVMDTRTYNEDGTVKFPGSSASGRYQQLTSTLDQNAKAAGLSDSDLYNQKNQDLIFQSALRDKMGLGDYLDGKVDMSDEALISKFTNEYAAVKGLNSGGSYDDDGANKGTIPAEDVLEAVKAIREEGMG